MSAWSQFWSHSPTFTPVQRPPLPSARCWTDRLRTTPDVDSQTSKTYLIGTVVAVIAAPQQPWVSVKLLESDDNEFDGDILQSPIGLVFLVTALLLVVGAAATVLGRAHRAQWRAITASVAVCAIFTGFHLAHRPGTRLRLQPGTGWGSDVPLATRLGHRPHRHRISPGHVPRRTKPRLG